MSETDDLKRMVMSFKKQELQAILQFAGLNKLGTKAELQARTMRMVKRGESAHVAKVRELYDVFGRPRMVEQIQFPVHPDVRLKELPFYEKLGELLKPSSLIPSSVLPKQVSNFNFYLTPQQAMSVSSSAYSIEVQLRFCQLDSSRLQDDIFPQNVSVWVNRLLIALPSTVANTKAGAEPKRPQIPVNITPLVLLNPTVANEISVAWTHEFGQGYVIAVNLVRKLTSSDLLQKLRAKGRLHCGVTVGTINEKLLGDADCELANTSLKVSLLCPLGKSRLVTPCRANTCKHLQCFDASMYLQMNERKSTWVCPVCHESALYENLLIDGYFLRVLTSPELPYECNNIILYEDGIWAPKKEGPVETVPEALVLDVDNDDLMILDFKPLTTEKVEKVGKVPTITVSIPVVDLISSDDDDDEDLKQQQRQHSKQQWCINSASTLTECIPENTPPCPPPSTTTPFHRPEDEPIIVPDSPSSTSSSESAVCTLVT